MMKDLTFWRGIKVGAIVTLKDERTIGVLISMKHPNAVRGLEMKVVEKHEINERNNLCNWTLYKLESLENIVLYLLVKSTNGNFDLRVYTAAEWFTPDVREEVINRGDKFLFAAPRNSNFVPAELETAVSFNLAIEGRDVAFNRKNPTMYGDNIETNQTGKQNPVFAGVSEYLATEKVPTPEVMVLELGGLDEQARPLDCGGLLVFLEGWTIDATDADVLSR